MKYGYALVLATTMLSGSAWADVYRPASRIDAVTVYPQGADVTRVADVNMAAGEHELILENLPASIDPQSIRVTGEAGEGVEIASVDSRVVPLKGENADVQRQALDGQISALMDERTALDQIQNDNETQRQFLLALANRQLVPVTTAQNSVPVDGSGLNGLLDVMGQRLGQLAKSTQDARIRQRGIDLQIEDLQKQMAVLAPEGGYGTDVVVHLVSTVQAKGTFRVSYRVPEAGWNPYYDARLTTPASGTPARVELVRRAEVVQSTTERWDGVALTLSTARPGGATMAPDIFETELFAELDRKRRGSDAGNAAKDGNANAPAATAMEDTLGKLESETLYKPKLEAVQQRQAFVEIVGFEANYKITGRVAIDNSGTSKKVRISSLTSDAKLQAVTVPRLDAHAYLTANFTVGGEGAVLPGAVNLYRDGVYVGQGVLPFRNAGEDAKLGFGADDLVKVKRDEVTRHTGEEGILTSSNVEERAWDITVQNLHGFTLPITILDRIPFVTRDDIEVRDMPGMTPATERNVDKRRGVTSWRFDLASKEEKLVKTGYKVTWPTALQVGQID
jgi:uncharacterized protein (TIGR02231 family)